MGRSSARCVFLLFDAHVCNEDASESFRRNGGASLDYFRRQL
jgi:hypothetical protein